MKETSQTTGLEKQSNIQKMIIVDNIAEEDQELITTFRGTISKIKDAITESSAVTVIAEKHIDKAGFYIKHYKTLTKILEQIRVSVVKPKNEEIKKINTAFKYFKSLYSAEETRLVVEVESVYKKIREAQELQRKKEQQEHDDALIDEAISFDDESVLETKQEIVIKKAKVSDSTSHIKSVRSKTFKIIDESLIPRKYFMLDERLIKAERALHDFEAKSTIEGIEFTFEERVSG